MSAMRASLRASFSPIFLTIFLTNHGRCIRIVGLLGALLAFSACSSPETRSLSTVVRHTAEPVRIFAAPSQYAAPDLPQQDMPSVLTFADFYNRVRSQSPDLAEQRALAQAAIARVGGAGAWMDPKISAMLAPQTIGNDVVGYGLQLTQNIPWPERLHAGTDFALAEAQVAVSSLQIAERHHLVKARAMYGDYWLNQERRRLYSEEVALLDASIQAAESQFAAGGSLMGLAEAKAMRAEVSRMRHMAERDSEVMGASPMRVMMGLSGDAAVPPADQVMAVDLSLIPEQADLLSLGRARPEVAITDARIAAARARDRDARANGRPDWEVMVGWTTMEPSDDMRFSVGLGFQLPIQQGPRQAARESSVHELRAAQAAKAQALAEADHEVIAAATHLRDHAFAITLITDEELPATAAAIQAAESAQAGGRGSLVDVIIARRRHLETQQRLIREQRDWFEWIGELEYCIGMYSAVSTTVKIKDAP